MITNNEILAQFTVSGLLQEGELLLRIIIAAFLGLLIGNERKNRNKVAGVRTHAIIAMGSALMMVVSKYGFADVDKVDAARLAAQVVSGIGFLGAGVIFVRNNLVNGLTTAAGMWTTAGIGLALGAGQYVLGISAGLFMLLVQSLLHKLSYFKGSVASGYLYLTITQKPGAVGDMRRFLEKEGVSVLGMKITKNKKGEIKVEFDVVYPAGFDQSKLLSKLVELEDVISVTD